MSADETKPLRDLEWLDAKIEEARKEYERLLKAKAAYIGDEDDIEIKNSKRKPDLLAKNVWRKVLQQDSILTRDQMREALIQHGWGPNTHELPDRAFARALTTNKESGNIFELEDGRFRKPTDQERASALEQRRKRLEAAKAKKVHILPPKLNR